MVSNSRIEIENINGKNFEILIENNENDLSRCPINRHVEKIMGETRKKSKKYDSSLSCRFGAAECIM